MNEFIQKKDGIIFVNENGGVCSYSTYKTFSKEEREASDKFHYERNKNKKKKRKPIVSLKDNPPKELNNPMF